MEGIDHWVGFFLQQLARAWLLDRWCHTKLHQALQDYLMNFVPQSHYAQNSLSVHNGYHSHIFECDDMKPNSANLSVIRRSMFLPHKHLILLVCVVTVCHSGCLCTFFVIMLWAPARNQMQPASRSSLWTFGIIKSHRTQQWTFIGLILLFTEYHDPVWSKTRMSTAGVALIGTTAVRGEFEIFFA